MKLAEYLIRIKRLDKLVRLKSTGNPKTLSEKLGVSEKTAYRCISDLKSLGAPIEYNRQRQTYVYKEGDFKLKLFID